MTKKQHVCPTCRREFRSVLDYPRVRVVALEELPIPEAVDRHSDAAARKRQARRADATGSLEEQLKRLDQGINMTPAIAEACRTAAVRELSETTRRPVRPRGRTGAAAAAPEATRHFPRGLPDSRHRSV